MRAALTLGLTATAIALTIASPVFSQAGGPYVLEETGQSFSSLQDAVNAIGDGEGTIRVAPGRYNDCAVQSAGNITFAASVPGKAVFEGGICEGKAVLVLRGQSARVDGLIFTHLQVPDGNGAGIRIEKGDLEVTNSMFLDSQAGILSAEDLDSTITIDRSTFSGLGKRPDGNGAHSLYIGHYGSLKITRSRFERGRQGHYLKCRAARVEILDNSFDDSQGHETNYMIDLSVGATGRIAGNSFEQGPDKENYSTMITVGPEGQENSSNGLIIEGNRAWASPGFKYQTTFVGNWTGDKVVVRNNELTSQIKSYADR